MIEVSGVRRSWEIERSSAVFSSSLRRSASASTISACIRSRSRGERRQLGQRPVGLLAPPLGLDAPGPAPARRRALLTTATIAKTDQRDPVLARRRSSKRCSGGMLEEVEGDGAGERGEQARAAAPRRSRSAGSPAGRRRPARPPAPPTSAGRRAACRPRPRRASPAARARPAAARRSAEAKSAPRIASAYGGLGCRRRAPGGWRRRRGAGPGEASAGAWRRRRFGRGFRFRAVATVLPSCLPSTASSLVSSSPSSIIRLRSTRSPRSPRCVRCRGRRVRAGSTVRRIRGSRRRPPIP